VLVGTKTADDAAVYRVSDELSIIQTVDFFTPIVDDPYCFGAIAAANSLSDVYAMGGKPALALNVVGFPRDSETLPMSVLAEILRGGAEKAREAGIDIVGGHTIDDREPKYGLCVTGFVHTDRYWSNVGARPGDRLLLTKPLGTGIISTALRSESANEAISGPAIQTMAALNRAAAEAAAQVDVHACTDVTGFGFLGHLREMLGERDLGVRVSLAAVPLLEGARDLAEQGFVPGGARRNLESLEAHIQLDAALTDLDRLLLCDPQTSGGLLFAVPSATAGDLLDRLSAAGVAAAEVGEFVVQPAGVIQVVA